jgi:hypothetical protein
MYLRVSTPEQADPLNLKNLFPDSVLNMRECKWVSTAVLRLPGHPDSTGMAIHEVVEWP